jgi:hypothetical protein
VFHDLTADFLQVVVREPNLQADRLDGVLESQQMAVEPEWLMTKSSHHLGDRDTAHHSHVEDME